MIANYHTHTPFSNHSIGTPREYIEEAIEAGFQTLGFSDHAPMPFKGQYYSGFRMKMHHTALYFELIRSLQKEYEKDIQILAGLECEYYPELFPDFCEFIEPFAPDYLIMGQHGLFNEENAPMATWQTEDEALLKQYVDQVCEGLDTGKFMYLAHPDMMYFVGDERVYEQETTRLCEFCKAHNIPLEINLLGLGGKRHYPRESFWEIAAKVGNTAIIGCDTHDHGVLKNKELQQMGKDWANKFGVTLLPSLTVK